MKIRNVIGVLAALLLCPQMLWAGIDTSIYDLQAGQKYYIYSSYYKRPLGPYGDANTPRLQTYNEKEDGKYLFEAEQATTAGYVLLRNVQTGAYLIASGSNGYSVQLTTTSGTGNNYQWNVKPGYEGWLVNKKNTATQLGVDTGEEAKTDIGVWYDKTSDGTKTTVFEVIPADGKGLESSRKAYLVRELQNISAYINGEIQNTKYPLLYRTKLPKSLEVANAWCEHPETKSFEEMKQKLFNLQDSLALMTTFEASVLLTETEMKNFGEAFSLGIANLEMDTNTYANDSLYLLIRSKNGRGALVAIRENGNYAFVYENAQIKVYNNKVWKETLPAIYIPRITAQGLEAEWTLIRKSRYTGGLPVINSQSKAVLTEGEPTVNKYGNKERTVISLAKTKLTLDEQIDFHIISESTPLDNSTIDLTNEQAWVIFDNIRPSKVKSEWLKYIRINGKAAQADTNCRVVIYLNGALVMPYSKMDEKIFVGYEGEQYSGTERGYGLGNMENLGQDANRFRSFRLKRGYMVTVASGTKGSGYSRVYVADHHDIEVPVLPNALYGRISSLHVKKWQYVSKKGYCSSKGSAKDVAGKIRATWFYSWSADNSANDDLEYIPIRQHKWWPSMSQIGKHENATACLSINEPEHSEQHNNCDCGGAVSEWTACTLTPDFQQTGMRIGSPAPTDAGWLTNYIGHCNDMAYRCDFVAIHCYWGSNEANDGAAWYNKLKAIYEATKRPIWITEWAYGASWTNESWPSGWSDKLEQNRWRVKDIMQKLEEAPFVERYAYYEHDTQFRNLVDWSDGHITPAGKVYRDMKSNFAYNADVQFTPVWWAPGLKTPTLKVQINEADFNLIVSNGNTDVTDILTIQRRTGNGEWTDFHTEKNRNLFDQQTITYTFPLSKINPEEDQFRVYVKRTLGDEAYSPIASTGLIVNPNIYASSKTEVEGWQCERSAANGYTKSTGDTYFEVWDATAAGMQFDYYQNIEDLPEGIYELSAQVFNTTDNVQGAAINGSVALYAQADSVQYLANVTKDTKMEDAETLTIGNIVVRNGNVRVGVKNVGEMSGRWAGADNFKLVRKANLPEAWEHTYYTTLVEADSIARALFFVTQGETADASAYIVNPKHQRKDNYGWTTSNTETGTGKSYDNQSGNAYWNMWKASPYTATMTQDISYLPEGLYSVNALVRGGVNEQLTLEATVLRARSEENLNESATAMGVGEVQTDYYPNGWFPLETRYVEVRPGDTLRITFKAQNESGSAWYSVDNFGLTYQFIEPLNDAVNEVTLPQPQSSAIYDLQGRRISIPTKGIFIRNGKKYVR